MAPFRRLAAQAPGRNLARKDLDPYLANHSHSVVVRLRRRRGRGGSNPVRLQCAGARPATHVRRAVGIGMESYVLARHRRLGVNRMVHFACFAWVQVCRL